MNINDGDIRYKGTGIQYRWLVSIAKFCLQNFNLFSQLTERFLVTLKFPLKEVEETAAKFSNTGGSVYWACR